MSSRPRFDYDHGDIHRTYAAGRALSPLQIEFWSALLTREVGRRPLRRVVDLGCGIGRFSPLLRDVFGGAVIGIDRSQRMLAVAAGQEAPGTHWVRASAEALPLRTSSADLVFMFLVYHHLVDRAAALRECAQVLAPEGTVVIVNATIETLDSHVWLPFFPSARAIDRGRLPSRAAVLDTADAAGLSRQRRLTALNPVAPDLRAYADRIASRTISTLQLVPDDEFARGIEAFRQFCERDERGEAVVDQIDVFVLRRAA